MKKLKLKRARINSRRKPSKRKQRYVGLQRNMFANSYRTTLRVVWDVGSDPASRSWNDPAQSFGASITTGYIVTQIHRPLYQAFNSIRVHSITARWYQAVRNSDRIGYNTSFIADPEIASISNLTNEYVVAAPGSTISPDGTVFINRWIPREPSDRDYYPVDSKHVWADYAIFTWPATIDVWDKWTKNKPATTGSVYSNDLYGKLIVDVDVQLLGLPSTFRDPKQFNLTPCECKRCLELADSTTASYRHEVQRLHLANGNPSLLPNYHNIKPIGNPADYYTSIRHMTAESSQSGYNPVSPLDRLTLDSPELRSPPSTDA